MRIISRIVVFISLINYTSSQFITVGSPNNSRPGRSTCDNSSKSALVEHFFNIIFNEFHSAPPVCVCVQMCPAQPTYCYPNGCLKKADFSKKPEAPLPVTRISENTKPIFFYEEKNDFMDDLLNKNYLDENKVASEIGVPKQANVIPINLRPDPFKDRYKILFKYKKMPKVELKYNLGEQVKNMKSDHKDNVDISRTRWPVNKINSNRLNRQRNYVDTQGNDNPKFYTAIYTEKEATNYPPKYFKRELVNGTNNKNKNEDDINLDYTEIKKDIEHHSYSLEKLIDSLIESSFKLNESEVIPQNDINTDSTSVKPTTPSTTEPTPIETTLTESVTTTEKVLKIAVTEENLINDTTSVVSMNLTNENIDVNKYMDTEMTNITNHVNEMIASLSQKIELQNNTSMEIMRRLVGKFEIDTMSDKYIEHTTTKDNSEAIAVENAKRPVNIDRRKAKKSRQRLARKLKNSKNN